MGNGRHEKIVEITSLNHVLRENKDEITYESIRKSSIFLSNSSTQSNIPRKGNFGDFELYCQFGLIAYFGTKITSGGFLFVKAKYNY